MPVVNPWEAWVQAKDNRYMAEKLEAIVLAYNSGNEKTKEDPFITYLRLLPYEGEVLAAIDKATTAEEKKRTDSDAITARKNKEQDVYNGIIDVLLSKDSGKDIDHDFKKRAALHAFGYVIVMLMMLGTSATNSSSMYNYMISDEVGFDFGDYENIMKAFLYISSMMAQWMMYRKAVPDMMNKIFSFPNNEWGFLETRSLEFVRDPENQNKLLLKYRQDSFDTNGEWEIESEDQSKNIENSNLKKFKVDKLTALGWGEQNALKIDETIIPFSSAQTFDLDFANIQKVGTLNIGNKKYKYEYRNNNLQISSSIATKRKDADSYVETFYIDKQTVECYTNWEAMPMSIKIGDAGCELKKNDDTVSFDLDLSTLPGHNKRRYLMYGLSACTFFMVTSFGMLVLEKVAKFLNKSPDKDGLLGLSEDVSINIAASFAVLIGIGVGFLWTKVLREKFKEKEKEEKREMILAALRQLKQPSTPKGEASNQESVSLLKGSPTHQNRSSTFYQFFVPTKKDDKDEEKVNWLVIAIVGLGLLSSISYQTKNTFGLIEGWADGNRLPNTSEYDPINLGTDGAAYIIPLFFLFVITAPGSRFIFSCFSLTNLFKLSGAMKDALTAEAVTKEISTYRLNYAVGSFLLLGILSVFLTSRFFIEEWHEPLTNGDHGWMTGSHEGVFTPTGLSILGAIAIWGMFKWFRPPVVPLKPLLNLKDSSETRSGQQVCAAVVNALSFGAIGGSGMIFFLEDVVHLPYWFKPDSDGPDILIKLLSIVAMVTLGMASLSTSMQPVRLSETKNREGKMVKSDTTVNLGALT